MRVAEAFLIVYSAVPILLFIASLVGWDRNASLMSVERSRICQRISGGVPEDIL